MMLIAKRSRALLFFLVVLPLAALEALAAVDRCTPPPPGDTVTIVVRGSNTTIMPCSMTGTLSDRFYDMEVRATITYLAPGPDDTCVERTFTYRNAATHEVGALSGGGFEFTWNVQIPDAYSVISTNVNARVRTLQCYGIHGWNLLTNDGVGVGTNYVTVRTTRSGQQCVVPGALPECLDGTLVDPPPTVPDPPPIPAPVTNCTGLSGEELGCCLGCVQGGSEGYAFWSPLIGSGTCMCTSRGECAGAGSGQINFFRWRDAINCCEGCSAAGAGGFEYGYFGGCNCTPPAPPPPESGAGGCECTVDEEQLSYSIIPGSYEWHAENQLPRFLRKTRLVCRTAT